VALWAVGGLDLVGWVGGMNDCLKQLRASVVLAGHDHRSAEGPHPPPLLQPAVLLCLLDVVRGLEYLHSCSIVHGGKGRRG